MSQEDTEFLRDQVHRLSSLLAKYQEASPSFVPPESSLKGEQAQGSQPWITGSKELSPLLQEYDATIHGLQAQLGSLQQEVDTLRRHASDLVQENESLRRELRENLESNLSMRPSELTGDDGEGDLAIFQNLQQQVEITTQEKEAAEEKWREAVQEVDRLEAELEMEKESHQWRVVEQQAHQVKDQYQQSVGVLNREVETLQADLSEARASNSTMSQKVSELKLTVHDLQQQLIWKDQEQADNIFKEGVSDSKIMELRRIMDDLKQRLTVQSTESEELRRENMTHLSRISMLQQRLSDTESRENDAIVQVREAVQMVEAVVMEKDEAFVAAHQKEEEAEELRGVIAKLIRKAGARTREEVDAVRKQSNDRISQLTEELHALEMGSAEKQARLDRLLREKRAVESELSQIYKDGMVEGAQSKEAYQQLNKRAVDAERARDEATVKMEALQADVDQLKMDNEQLKQVSDGEIRQLKERLTSIQSEFEVVTEDRESSLNKINELNKQVLAANKEKEAAHRKYLKELALVEQDQHVRTRDYEVRLQTTEDARRQTVVELRRLLTAQQRMSARWKEECHTVTHKFEGKMEDLRGELHHAKRRNEELSALLKESHAKTEEVERMLSDYAKNIRRMEERVRESEIEAAESAKRTARQSLREKQMASERASLALSAARSQRNGEFTKDVLGGSGRGDAGLMHSRMSELTLDQLSSSSKPQSAVKVSGDR